MVTEIYLLRKKLITKEDMEDYSKRRDSVNDDLESLFEDLRLGKEPDLHAHTYFLPKLTNEEMKLVDRKDSSYFQTFPFSNNADVPETEMMLSESKSKFVYGMGYRRTLTIQNPSKQNVFDSCSLQ